MSRRGASEEVLVSAHRMGAGGDRARENSLPALEQALALGVDYVEFDVWRRDDGTFVVAHHVLARLGVAAYARRRGLPLLVWTVDTPGSLRYWTRPGRAWLVTTNQPGLALKVRSGVSR